MALIEVAEGIPCPQTSTVSPEERRLQSDGNYGPRQLRTIELDERQFQPLSWTLSSDQAEIWKTWWRDTLIYGGAWFSAPDTWPAIEGLVVKVRRFIGAPEWSYIGLGYWRVSAQVEVRGETELPETPSDFQYLFLDTFTGAEGTSIVDHAQDIPLQDSNWSIPVSTTDGTLDGAGHMTQDPADHLGHAAAQTSFFGILPVLQFPWRVEFELTPLAVSGTEADRRITTMLVQSEFTVDLSAPALSINFYPQSGSTPVPQLTIAGTGSPVSYDVEDGPYIISVEIEEDGWTATINGVAQDKVSESSASSVFSVYLYVGSYFDGEAEVLNASLIDRVAIFGARAPEE